MTLVVRFQILLLSALSAHALAGGSLVETPNLLLQGFGLGFVLFCSRSIKLEGPTLALLILFTQSASHLLIGGGTYQSQLRMTLAHFLSGVLSYFAVAYFEKAREFIKSTFVYIVPAKPFLIPFFTKHICFINASIASTFQIRQITAFLKFRGPPFSWEF